MLSMVHIAVLMLLAMGALVLILLVMVALVLTRLALVELVLIFIWLRITTLPATKAEDEYCQSDDQQYNGECRRHHGLLQSYKKIKW